MRKTSPHNSESKHPNEGPRVGTWLKEEGLYEESEIIAAKRILAWEIEALNPPKTNSDRAPSWEEF